MFTASLGISNLMKVGNFNLGYDEFNLKLVVKNKYRLSLFTMILHNENVIKLK